MSALGILGGAPGGLNTATAEARAAANGSTGEFRVGGAASSETLLYLAAGVALVWLLRK